MQNLILWIDDQPVRSLILNGMLGNRLFEEDVPIVIMAYGYEQVDYYLSDNFPFYRNIKMIICDHDMFGFDGMEVCMTFLRDNLHLPIILCSANIEGIEKQYEYLMGSTNVEKRIYKIPIMYKDFYEKVVVIYKGTLKNA